jgi:hypothetical protein
MFFISFFHTPLFLGKVLRLENVFYEVDNKYYKKSPKRNLSQYKNLVFFFSFQLLNHLHSEWGDLSKVPIWKYCVRNFGSGGVIEIE